MRDKISIARCKLLHPAIRGEVPVIIDEVEKELPVNLAIRVVQGLRTFEEQDALYQKGRTTKGPRVTNAKPGSSYHQYGLAVDFALLVDKNNDGKFDVLSWDIKKDSDDDSKADWFEVVEAFKRHGYESGAEWRTFKDYPHVQKTFGFTWKQLYLKSANGDFIPGTKYVNLGSVTNTNT